MKTGGIINNYYAFIFILTLFYGAVFCFSGFVGTPFGSFKDLIMLVLQWGVVLFATYGLLMVISVCKYESTACLKSDIVVSDTFTGSLAVFGKICAAIA